MERAGGKKSALITGASSGIGRAIARALAADGYDLTLVARNPGRLKATAEEVRDDGLEIEDVPGDVTSEDTVKEVIAFHRDRHGSLDLLVNNAGMGVLSPMEKLAASKMDLQYRLNLRQVALFYRESIDLLEAAAGERGVATVVNVSSISGLLGEKDLSFYAAVKAGVVGLTKSMNAELQGRGIKSCVLCPGFVDTPLSEYAHHEVGPEKMIQPEDLAQAVRFVAGLSSHCMVPEIDLQRVGDSRQVG
jgi:NAD(P)-dependent dehydrogenase (short-subunit alcohol dehydrogenase family)